MENAEFTKVCKKCKETKQIAEFGKNSRLLTGTFHACKVCINNKNKRLREANPELYANHKKVWAKNNPEKELISKSRWIENNKDKRRETLRKNKNRRYKQDVYYKLTQNVRNRLSGLFKKTPSTTTLKLLGCSIPEYKAYLEVLFETGMTWQNHKHDGWHIDHIKPIASFDLTDPTQLAQAFHYTNTQPLWARDNLQKKDRLDWSKHA